MAAADRQANGLEHVRFAEVTERGYCTLDLTREGATVTWWHVDPWEDDPGSSAEAVAAFQTLHADWPPRLEAVRPATGDPDRPGLIEPLPARPDDLRSIRRRRKLRISVEIAVAATAAASACWSLARLLAGRRPAARHLADPR